MTPVLWEPRIEYVAGTRLASVMLALGESDYSSFYRRSVDDPEAFWRATLDEIGWQWFRDFSSVAPNCPADPAGDWFPDGRTNAAHNALWPRGHEDRVVLVEVGETGEAVRWTRRQLAEISGRCAAGLLERGVGPGDRIGLLLPFDSRAASALLAVSRIGAVAVPVFTGFGARAVAQRLEHAGCSVVVTCGGFVRGGKQVELNALARAAVDLCAHPVVVEDYDALLVAGQTAPDVGFASMSAQDPLLIAYTSGTDGLPKGAVHTHAGLPVKTCQELTQMMDLGADSVLLRVTDLGWVGGPNTILGGLTTGARIVMYGGSPAADGYQRIWNLVRREQVTHLAISPSFARLASRADHRPTDGGELEHLHVTSSVGEPWDMSTYAWFAQEVCRHRVPIINHSGGTEVGNLLGNVPCLPIDPGRFNTPVPGVDVDVVNSSGESLRGEPGRLVVRRPFVGMTQALWRDPDRYNELYWSRVPGMWDQGDLAVRADDGHFAIVGRSDDRIKISGRGVMPEEIESAACRAPGISGALAVALTGVGGEQRLVVVVESEGHYEGVGIDVQRAVVDEMGRAFAPAAVIALSQLPRGPGGKLLRRAARDALAGRRESGNLTVSEPALVELARLGPELGLS